MFFLFQYFPWVVMWVGIFIVAKEVQAKTRVLLAAIGTILLITCLLSTDPMVRFWDSWLMFIFGTGCLAYWYKLSIFG